MGTGDGARPSEAVPLAHELRASHTPRPRTRSGAKASEKAGGGDKRNPTQSDKRRERGTGRGGQVEEQTASKTAGKWHHGVKGSLDKGKCGKEGPVSRRRRMQMSQPQGAASAPPLQPPPRPSPSPQWTDIEELGDRSTCKATVSKTAYRPRPREGFGRNPELERPSVLRACVDLSGAVNLRGRHFLRGRYTIAKQASSKYCSTA